MLVGRSARDFIDHDPTNAWGKVREAGGMRGHFALRRPDGTTRDLEFSATADILPGLHLSALRDVTERNLAQREIARSDARFRALVRASRRAVIDDPGTSAVARCRVWHRDGSIRWIEATLTNRLADPAVGAFVTNLRDVTEAHLGAEALRESEQRYRVLIEHSPEPTLVHVDRKIAFANEAAARAIGVASAADLMGRSILEFVTPESLAQLRARVDAGGEDLLGDLVEQSFRRVDDGRVATFEVAS